MKVYAERNRKISVFICRWSLLHNYERLIKSCKWYTFWRLFSCFCTIYGE